MPSAAGFGQAYRLAKGFEIPGTGLQISHKKIGHDPVKPNRHYLYPIRLTLSPTSRKRKRDSLPSGEKKIDVRAVVKEWVLSALVGERHIVWTFYGNPYDIWIRNDFKIETNSANQLVVTATGEGQRNFTEPKKPPAFIAKRKPSVAVKEVSSAQE